MATFKVLYDTWADFTITLASLTSDANLLAGRESTARANTTLLAEDYWIGGKVTTGTSPTVSKHIELWVYANIGGATTYPDVFDGTDSDETVTSDAIKASTLYFVDSILTDATSDRAYWFRPASLVQVCRGVLPENFGLFVVHDTAVDLNSTGSNHKLSYLGVNEQSV